RAHVGLEHQVEAARVHERPAVVRAAQLGRVLAGFESRQVVEPEPLVALGALDERVRERLHVAARLPHTGRHADARVEADDVVAQLHHRAPTRVLDVALQLDTQWAVIPAGAQPTVDLARLEDDAPAFGQGRDGLHRIGHWGSTPLSSRPVAPAAGVGTHGT